MQNAKSNHKYVVIKSMSGPKCARCGVPVSYGNIYCKRCGGTGIIKL